MMKSNAALVAVVVTGMASALASGMMVGCDDTSQGVTVFSNGTYVVGRDVKPGTYTNSHAEHPCRWTIYKEEVFILDWHGAHEGDKPYTVDLESGHSFMTTGCGSWQRQ